MKDNEIKRVVKRTVKKSSINTTRILIVVFIVILFLFVIGGTVYISELKMCFEKDCKEKEEKIASCEENNQKAEQTISNLREKLGNEKENEVSLLKIYENEKYNYTLNTFSEFSIELSGAKTDIESLIRIRNIYNNSALYSIHVKKVEYKNLEEWLSEYKKELSLIGNYEGVEIESPSIISSEKTLIGGKDAMKLVMKNMPYSNYLIVFIKDEFLYTASYNGFLEKNEDEFLKEIPSKSQKEVISNLQLRHQLKLEQIMASFKFTK